MKVAPHIVEIIGRAETDGTRLILRGQLDRADYVHVDKALKAAGGNWDRLAGAHVFAGDAAAAVEPILLTGEVVSKKAELGQFFTPPDVAERVIRMARLRPGLDVLEPSAGIGELASRAWEIGCNVDCIEIDAWNVSRLEIGNYRSVIQGDFLNVAVRPIYDRVVMNPPFARQADIHHVDHALGCLKPDGRLVAIMSASITFRDDKTSRLFRQLVAERNARIEPLPSGAFRPSGTAVHAVIVTFGAAA